MPNQYLATVHHHPDGDWDGYLCVWRGQRFLKIRCDYDGLVRRLLLCRVGRAELTDMPEGVNDLLRVLVRLASGAGAEAAGHVLTMFLMP